MEFGSNTWDIPTVREAVGREPGKQKIAVTMGLSSAGGNGEEGAQPETLLKGVFVCRGETVCYRPGPVAKHFLT